MLSEHLKSRITSEDSLKNGYKVEITPENHIILTPALKEHKYSLIWMHGLGDSAEGFVDLFLDKQS